MCVVSMVYDEYSRRDWTWPDLPDTWPKPYETAPVQPLQPSIVITPQPTPAETLQVIAVSAELDRLRKLIDEFREAVAAAKTVDRLTNKPDCEDPKKKALEARVAELERRLDESAPRKVAKKRKAKARSATP